MTQVAGLLLAITLSGCGSQITALRRAASTATDGIATSAPAMTSLTILNSTPTRGNPLDLDWGLLVGTYDQYCLLENSTDSGTCIWKSGALPLQYLDSAPDGMLELSAYFRNSFGTSTVISSNTVVIDRTPPILASATVTNSNPTNSTSYALSYGAVTNLPYSHYCIQENDTNLANCTWTAGALPAAYTVAAVDGPKELSFWLRDAAGNVSLRVAAAPVTLDSAVPTVAFANPPAGTLLGSSGIAAVAVTGTCSETGRNVVISGAASATVLCSGGAWSANLDFSAAADGTVTVFANHTDAAGNAAVQASRAFTKDTAAPTVAISNPAAGTFVNLANQAAFAVDGTCSENTRNVVITGDATATVVCTAGAWSANLNFTAAAQGVVTILVNHNDAAGNNAPQDNRSFTKDTLAPTLAISNPAAGSIIGAGSVAAFTVDGTCSENTRNVVISGDAAATVACTAGAWSANLDFTAAADGAVSIAVDHSDAAGNPAPQVTRAFVKDTGLPTVTIANPAANTYINAANVAAFTVDGACSENTRNVVISGDASATVTCTAGAWSANLDFTAAAQGTVTINVNHSDAGGNNAVQASRNFVKDTVLPTLAISNPAAGSAVNAANVASFTVDGTCSENTRDVVITGDAAATVACTAGAWTANLDFTAAAAGAVSIAVNHADAAGNPATTQNRSFTKDVTPPTLAISNPAAGSTINLASVASFTVDGTCSENTRDVVITGDASATVSCTAGAWSANLDFSAASDGVVSIAVNHSDAAGNNAPTQNRSFNKDSGVPTVDIDNPAALAYINTSNVSSFAVDGSCSENTRDVVISGAASATVTCTAGAWSANLDFTAAAQGVVTINVNHSDAGGNNAVQASRNFTKDTVVPTLAISNPAAGANVTAGNMASFTVDGTCSENTRDVVITGDASATVSCTAGAWSANLDFSAASDGAVSIAVNHNDAAGNVAITQNRSFNKDSGVPTVDIDNPAALAYINTSNVSSFAVDGSCSENTRDVVISGAASATVTCTAGAWSANLDFTAAAQGVVTINVNHSDAGGNNAVQASRNFTKDTVVPTLAISNPAAGAGIYTVNFATFAVDGTCSENTRNVVISGDASATVVCTAGAWSASLDFTSASDGPVTIDVDHTDAAGNSAVQASRTFNKDTGIPTLTIANPAAGSAVNAGNVASFTVDGTCSENTRDVVITGDASATVTCTAGAWTANLDFTLAADGAVSIAVNHSDALGNPAITQNRSFNKDVGVPTVAISTPAANSYINAANVAAFAVTGTCSENTRDVVISGAASATVTCTAGAWSANLDFTAAGQGNATINVDHSDAGGNPAVQASRTFIKDTGIPTLAISTPADGSNITAANFAAYAVTGTCSENTRDVVISGDASATVTCTAGAWSANLDFTAASDGAVSIAVNHSDVAGNPATTQNRNFNKDVGVPTVAISTPAANSYINAANVAAFAVTGTCSENTRDVVISGAASATVTCTAGAWSANLDFTAAGQGNATINVDHSDAGGNPAVQASRTFIKDTGIPTLAISTPADGSNITAANFAAYAVTGTCSENTRDVVISGDASATVTCTAGAWSANLDFTAASDGAVSIAVNHSDVAGNPATTQNRSFNKDVGVPTVAISTPAANSYINAANVAAFAVTGTCSENTRDVVISGAASATVTCTAGAWSANLDFTAAGQGNATINVDHSDAVGNSATQASRTFIKDTVLPTVAGVSPADMSYMNSSTMASFAVSGTCSENTRDVVITGDAAATVTCTAGAWSANLDFTAAAAGNVTINVNHSDAAGNPATQDSGTFVKDVAAPTVAITSPAAGTYANIANQAAFPVSGTCSDNGEDVSLSRPSGANLSTTCAGGTWSINYDFTTATDGAYSLTVQHLDAAGNPASDSRSFNLDKTAPTLAITSPAAASVVNAAGTAAFQVSGTCSDNGRVVYLTGAYTANATCTAGAFTITANISGLAEGDFTVDLDMTDVAGNAATQVSRTFNKDATAPALAISTPAAGSYINSSNVTAFAVTGTCGANGEDVVISGDASATVTCTAGAWSANLDFTTAGQGAVTIDVDHSDAAGNPATQVSRNFTKDTSAPTLAFTTPAAGAFITSGNMAAFNFQGTCSDNGRTVTLSAPVAGSDTCTAGAFSITVDVSALGQGTHWFDIATDDAAGNTSATVQRNYVKDTSAPTLAITSPAANAWMNSTNHSAFPVAGTCSAADNGQTITFSGGATGSTTCAAGTWSANADFSAAGQGATTLLADMSDAAGNAAPQASRAFQKDTVAPTITVTAPAGGSTWAVGEAKDITWTASDGGSGLTGMLVDLDYNVGGGAFQTIVDQTANDGTHSWTVVNDPSAQAKVMAAISDVAGNSGSYTSADFTIIAPYPEVSSITVVDALTDADIQTLTDGATLDLATLPSRYLNFRTNVTYPSAVGSVVAAISGTIIYGRTENGAPYATLQDSTGNYTPLFQFVPGPYTHTATPYTAASGGGTAGATSTINFTLTDSTALSFAMDFTRETIVPIVGNQTFTFTRSGSTLAATHHGRDGKLRFAPHNFHLYSEAIDNTTEWTLQQVSVSADVATAPDGTETADKMIPLDVGNYSRDVYQYISKPALSLPYTCSVYAKADGYNFAAVEIETSGAANAALVYFDLRQGTAGSHHVWGAGITYLNKSITAVGDDWYRISLTAMSDTQTNVDCAIFMDDNDPNTASSRINTVGATTDGVLFWGVQFEQNLSPSTYLATTTAVRYNGPRYDYDPITKAARGIRFDENSTNLALYSEDFGNAAWTKTRSTVTTNTSATTDPMGSNFADSLVEDSTTGQHNIRQIRAKAASALPYAASVYAKAGSRTNAMLEVDSEAGGYFAFFDLSAGTVGTTGYWGSGWADGRNSIEAVGDGWYRLTVAATSDTTTVVGHAVGTVSGGTASYAGNGSGNIYIYGAQLEQPDQGGGSTMLIGTNYIPTTSATVSRSSEYLETTGGLGSWFNSSGTWYIDWKMTPVLENGANTSTLMSVHSGGATKYRINLRPGAYVAVDRENPASANVAWFREWVEGGILGTSNFKAAFTTSAGDTVARLNGQTSGQVVTNDTFAVVPTAVSFGNNTTSSPWEPFTGWIKEVRFYPTRIADGELTAMTSQAAPPGMSDDFNDNSISGTKWASAFTSGWCSLCTDFTDLVTSSEVASQIRLALGTTLSGYGGLVTTEDYDFTGASAEVELIQPGKKWDTDNSNSGCGQSTMLSLFPSANTTFYGSVVQYLVNGTFLDLRTQLEFPTGTWGQSGVTSGGEYTANTSKYRYMRIRHDTVNDNLTVEFSANRYQWIPRWSRNSASSVTAVRIALTTGASCAAGDAEANTGAVFDNFSTDATQNP